jgi:hypothetical protein
MRISVQVEKSKSSTPPYLDNIEHFLFGFVAVRGGHRHVTHKVVLVEMRKHDRHGKMEIEKERLNSQNFQAGQSTPPKYGGTETGYERKD